jgi:hypothetical protein
MRLLTTKLIKSGCCKNKAVVTHHEHALRIDQDRHRFLLGRLLRKQKDGARNFISLRTQTSDV